MNGSRNWLRGSQSLELVLRTKAEDVLAPEVEVRIDDLDEVAAKVALSLAAAPLMDATTPNTSCKGRRTHRIEGTALL